MAQTEANEYRSERKERIAKNSKQKNKKNVDSTRIVSAVLIAICIIALLAAIGGGLYAYGVPQKLLPAVKVDGRTYSVAEYGYYYTSVYQTYANQSYSYQQQLGFSLGFDYTKDPAEQTTKDEDGNEMTYAEFFKNSVIETLESYNYYLKLAKAEGMELTEENKEAIDATIDELATYASTYGYSTNRYINVLYGKGLSLNKFRSLLEEQYLVSQYVEKQTAADEADITMDAIEAKFNEAPADYQAVDLRLFGLSLKDEETNTEDEPITVELTDDETTTAEAASEETTSEETTSEEQTSAEETEAAEETTAADTDEETTAEEVTEKELSKQELLANEMLEKITDEESFIKLAKEYCAEADKATFEDDSATLAIGITKSVVQNNIDKDLAEWLFDAERQVGDKTVVSTSDYVYVIMVKNTAYRNEAPLVSARHILVSYEAVAAELKADGDTETETETETETDVDIDTSNTSYEAKVITEAYKQAKAILDEYKAGEMTEDAFAALAEKYTDDTASVGENSAGGGLYTDIEKGKMVEPFESWVYDEARQPGDTGLVQTNYGWHVMYFVSAHEEAPWVENIRSAIATEKQTERDDAVKEETDGTAAPAAFEGYAAKEALKLINKLYVKSNAAQA